MTTIQTDGARVEIAQVGRGPDLVLLHSLLTDRSAFDRILTTLAQTRRVTLISLPGFGASDPVEQGIFNYADRVAATMDALDLSVSTDVMGNGFGGFIATALAIRHGKRLGKLLLADTGAVFDEAGRNTFKGMASRVETGGMEAILDLGARRLFSEGYIAANPDLIEACKSVLLRADVQAFATACRSLAELDLQADLHEVANDALVVVGEHDAATPPALGRALAEALPRGNYVEMPDCAHAPQIQQPTAFLGIIAPFLGLNEKS